MSKLSGNECDRCGAPLRKAPQKGQYFCAYCGMTFTGTNYSGYNADEKPEKTISPKIPPGSLDRSNTQYQDDKKSRKLTIGFFIAGLLGICLTLLIIGSLSSPNRARHPESRSVNTKPGLKKPAMLASLPNAAKAGSAVAYAHWELIVSPEISVSGAQISFAFILRNWHDQTQVFRYKPITMIVYDDLGRTYPLSLGNCAPDLPFFERQITLSPYENINFQSSRSWCNRAHLIPTFSGVIPHQANQLYLHFEEFGVFSGLTIVFDL